MFYKTQLSPHFKVEKIHIPILGNDFNVLVKKSIAHNTEGLHRV